MPTSQVALDELYVRLKRHDREWLETALQTRWAEFKASQNLPRTPTLTPATSPSGLERPLQRSIQSGYHLAASNTAFAGIHDLTAPRLAHGRVVSAHVAAIRSFDWASTELGPMSQWSYSLRQWVSFILSDPSAAVIWIGPNRICIYNELYTSILAGKHPAALGQPLRNVWPEILDHDYGLAFGKADSTGEATKGEEVTFFVERQGFLEEIAASYSVIPILGEDGVMGYYNTVSEHTDRVLYQRRMSTLLRLDKRTRDTTNVKQFWKQVLLSLESNHHEVPFAVLYSSCHEFADTRDASSMDDARPIASSCDFESRSWTLEGTLGLPDDSSSLPVQADAAAAAELFTGLFEESLQASKIQMLRAADDTLRPALHGIAKSRTYGDQCDAVVLCPIGPTHRGTRNGFLLLGIDSRRNYDSAYEQFIQLLVRQLVTTLASVGVAEDEESQVRRASELAELERKLLAERLAITEHEAQQNEAKFRTAASHMPVAMFEHNSTGEIVYANDRFYQLTTLRPDDLSPNCLMDIIHPGDREAFEAQWTRIRAGHPIRYEVRLTVPFVADDVIQGEKLQGETWVAAASYAHLNADGSVKVIQGCLVDISREHWMVGYQRRRTNEAIERRRQQERFMDIIAHEARNPLSAITLCTDNILSTAEDVLKGAVDQQITLSRDTVAALVENSEIIMQCAQHQKRIIDDVLTLSKLDSGLLEIAHVKVQPTVMLTQSMKMFEGDLQQADVDLQSVVDRSYQDHKIDWLELDPGRLLQVLINLATNAIKFTKDRHVRRITVTMSASLVPPKSSPNGVVYLEHSESEAGSPPGAAAPDVNAVYLSIAVTDTGCGIEKPALQKLFQRFAQASPKTYVDYGGSGLGLFICKELARLQEGKIGVASEYGVGSTFAFYIRATRCTPPICSPLRQGSSGSSDSRRSITSRHSATRQNVNTLLEEQPELPVPAAAESYHLLLVEDNLVNQKVMSKQLIRAGYVVSIANHGLEALDHIRKTKYCIPGGQPLDVILMDVEMPVMNGLEATSKIREMEQKRELSRHFPIIAVTANVRAEQQASAMEVGMDAVVTKPFRMSELLPELERMRDLNSTTEVEVDLPGAMEVNSTPGM